MSSTTVDGLTDAHIIGVLKENPNLILQGVVDNESTPTGSIAKYMIETGHYNVFPVNRTLDQTYSFCGRETSRSLEELCSKHPNVTSNAIFCILDCERSSFQSLVNHARRSNIPVLWVNENVASVEDKKFLSEIVSQKQFDRVVIDRDIVKEFRRLLSTSNKKHTQGLDTTQQEHAVGISREPRVRQHK
ncbi:hypothetical protein GEMRC1_011887 [Eukaryota sp. GEM-RC1]